MSKKEKEEEDETEASIVAILGIEMILASRCLDGEILNASRDCNTVGVLSDFRKHSNLVFRFRSTLFLQQSSIAGL